MKSKLLMILIAFAVPFNVLAEDIEIPDYIDAKIDDFDGSEIYMHVKLKGSIQSWIEKESGESVRIILAPAIAKDEGKATYYSALGLAGWLPERIGKATQLERFQIKERSDAPIQTIEFKSLIMNGKATSANASYKIELTFDQGNQITIQFMSDTALSLMKKIAHQTEDQIVTVRLDTSEGDLTMDVPLSVSKSVKEFYEWAKEFYKAKNLTWPDSEE